MPRRNFVVVSIAILSLQAACGEGGSSQPQASVVSQSRSESATNVDLVSTLKVALDACDPEVLTRVAGLIFRSRNAADGVSYLAEQWNRTDRSKCLDQPLIQAFIANALAQGYANGVGSGVDVSSVGASLRKGLESSDWEIAHVSISGLSAIAQPSDLKIFEQIAQTQKGQKREDALIELASQCSEEAGKILDHLAQQPGFSDVQKIKAEVAALRTARCQK